MTVAAIFLCFYRRRSGQINNYYVFGYRKSQAPIPITTKTVIAKDTWNLPSQLSGDGKIDGLYCEPDRFGEISYPEQSS
jgi:hypothetical protein